ncbi:BamA/TamA family outer membrane protein [Roseovarius sp. S4756]|uniref:BamA/TamA family outer membrane protein n=1 Tax=Roseovarius maritimus TaxID=3342637 RepID=UPI00372A3F4A
MFSLSSRFPTKEYLQSIGRSHGAGGPRTVLSAGFSPFVRLRNAFRQGGLSQARAATFRRVVALWVICLHAIAGDPGPVVAAESNLDHKLSPLNKASSKPEFGLRSGSVIVAPVPFSDPMIDSGLAIGAGYLFNIDEGSDTSMLGIGYLGSQNGSTGYGLTFNLNFMENRWSIGATYIDADINYDLISRFGTLPIEQEGELIKLKLLYGITPEFHLGVSARYLESTIRSSDPIFPSLPTNIRLPDGFSSVGFGVVADYARLDEKIYPTSGFNLSFSGTYNKPSNRFGKEYFKSILTYDKYFTAGDDGVVAVRLAGCSAPGRVPFYDLCSLGGTDSFRGFNITEFLDNALLSSQVEYRKRLGKRIGVVAFGGVGAVGGGFNDLDDVGSAVGLGLRYRVSKKFPVDFAVDGSISDEGDSLLYISVGQRF